MSSTIALQLLGIPQVWRGAAPVSGMRRKNRALLYIIAAQRQPLSREAAGALFWPDRERADAQPLMRTMVYELRRALGDALMIEHNLLALADDVAVDARQFEAIVAPDVRLHTLPIADLEGAVRLYHGDFLEGFGVPDAPAFEDWLAAERERFRLLSQRVAVALAQRYEAEQRYEPALLSAQLALRIDPLQEAIQCMTMRLLYHTGNRAGAIRQFELLRRLLDDELGVTPLPETRALYDAIIQDRLDRPVAQAPADELVPLLHVPGPAGWAYAQRLPFTGRANEWRQLQNACERQQLALIVGEPGIGKTRLAEEFAARHYTLVLRGVAHALDESLPYQPIIEALRALAARPDWAAMRQSLDLAPRWLYEAARLAPDLVDDLAAVPTTPASESLLWESVARFVQALAQRYRVLLLLDDLHWADGATLGLLGYLTRRALAPALAIVATARTTPQPPKLTTLLHEVGREERLVRIVPAPLSAAEIAILARATGGAIPWLAAWLNERSEGNPFIAAELLRFAGEQGWLAPDHPAPPDSLQESIPEAIRQMIIARVVHLSPLARHVLNLAAVIGREFALELIVQASQTDALSVIDCFDELGAAALIRLSRGAEYRFDHSLTLEVMQREMSAARARALHLRIAEALAHLHHHALDSVVGAIAQHFVAGGVPERAAPFALRAGQVAASLAAWTESIVFFEQVLASGVAELRSAALLGLGESQMQRGELDLAQQALQAALEATPFTTADVALIEQIYDLLLHTFIPAGRYAEAIAYGRALRQHGPPELALVASYVLGAGLSVEGTHLQESEQYFLEAERLLAQPRSFTSWITLAKLRFQHGTVLGQQGRLPEAIAMLAEATTLAQEDPAALDLQLHILAYNNLAHFRHLAGDPAAADDVRAGLRLAREKGSPTHQSYLLSTAGEIAMTQGDLEVAERFFAEGLQIAMQLQGRERIAGLHANLGRVALRRGQTETARERLFQALALADELGSKYLATSIRIWLVPLLTPDEAGAWVGEIRRIATENGYQPLLAELRGVALTQI